MGFLKQGLVKYCALPTYRGQENANLHPDSPNPASQIQRLVMDKGSRKKLHESLVSGQKTQKCQKWRWKIHTTSFHCGLGKKCVDVGPGTDEILTELSVTVERKVDIFTLRCNFALCTGRMGWMAYRKWKESKQ